jgi:hypothetical protein
MAMNSQVNDEQSLELDPLAALLAKAEVPPPSNRLRMAILAGVAPHGSRRYARWSHAAAAVVAGALVILLVTPVSAMVERAVLPLWLQQRAGLVGASDQVSPPGGAALPQRSNGYATAVSPMPCSQAPREGNVACYPDLSLAAAQKQVAFTIPVPAPLPAGMAVRGVLVESAHSVYLSIGDQNRQKGFGLWIRETAPSGGSAVPVSAIESTTVKGSPASFVRGSYEDSGPGTVARWNAAADDEELAWQHGGFAYDLTADGLMLSKAQLVVVAESLP